MSTMHPLRVRIRAFAAGAVARMVDRSPTLAVFIDGDGISPKDARKVLEHLPVEGRIYVLRTYGNYTGRAAEGWAKLIRSRGLIARHMPSLVPGKNAADIALAIDAVEVMLTLKIDTFVLVASDADFTPLACRLREGGKRVVVYGHSSTPESLRGACADFRDIGGLVPPGNPHVPPAPFWSRPPSDAATVVWSALAELDEDGQPVSLTVLGAHIAERQPGFDSRIYSRQTLGDLVRDLPSIALVEQDGERFAVRKRNSD